MDENENYCGEWTNDKVRGSRSAVPP